MEEKDFALIMHRYFEAILRIRQDLRQRVQKHLIEMGYADITLEMSQVLYSLKSMGGTANQQLIADTLSKNKSSITSLVDNLIKREMVEKCMNPDDRRNNIITLSAKGEQFMKVFYPAVYRSYDIGKISLTLKDIQTLTDTLNQIMDL